MFMILSRLSMMLLLFNDVVAVALCYAEKIPDIMVVVLAGHGTGGLMLSDDLSLESLQKLKGISWTTTSHTGAPVPLNAFGDGAEPFRKARYNADVPKKIVYYLEIEL